MNGWSIPGGRIHGRRAHPLDDEHRSQPRVLNNYNRWCIYISCTVNGGGSLGFAVVSVVAHENLNLQSVYIYMCVARQVGRRAGNWAGGAALRLFGAGAGAGTRGAVLCSSGVWCLLRPRDNMSCVYRSCGARRQIGRRAGDWAMVMHTHIHTQTPSLL